MAQVVQVECCDGGRLRSMFYCCHPDRDGHQATCTPMLFSSSLPSLCNSINAPEVVSPFAPPESEAEISTTTAQPTIYLGRLSDLIDLCPRVSCCRQMLVECWHVFMITLVFLTLLFIKWELYSVSHRLSGRHFRTDRQAGTSMAAPIIPILTLSQNREIARNIAKAIAPRNFSVNGILEMDPYSSRDLGLTLRVLEPRPLAVIMGRGYSDEEAEQAQTVFKDYMNETGVEDGTVVKISQKVFDEVGKDGISSWVQKQLEAQFRK